MCLGLLFHMYPRQSLHLATGYGQGTEMKSMRKQSWRILKRKMIIPEKKAKSEGQPLKQYACHESHDGRGPDGDVHAAAKDAVGKAAHESAVETILRLQASNMSICYALRYQCQTHSDASYSIRHKKVQAVLGEPRQGTSSSHVFQLLHSDQPGESPALELRPSGASPGDLPWFVLHLYGC